MPDDNASTGCSSTAPGTANPHGIAWDDEGARYTSEFGQNTRYEFGLIDAESNYGWPEVRDYLDAIQQLGPA